MNKMMMVGCAIAALVCSGCMSTAGWRDRELEKEMTPDWVKPEPGGHWKVESFTYTDNTESVLKSSNTKKSARNRERDILDWVKRNSDYTLMFKEDPKYKMIPVKLSITVEDGKSTTGNLALINNILSTCTLTVWPCVWSGEKNYKIVAEYPTGKLERTIVIDRRQMFSLLPLGLFPVPAWSDSHSRGSGTLLSIDDTYTDYENYVLRDQVEKFLNLGQYTRELKALEAAEKKQ